MLRTYSAPSEVLYENSQNVGLDHYWGILKRRALYFAASFSLVLFIGSLFVAMQRPIYEATGKVLVESQEIPTDLVRPTVTDTANERIQVIQQRIMTRDNLLDLVNKYGMFPRERQWMSDTQLLDLMRERTKFELVDIDSSTAGASTIAFSLSFDYENPDITLRVANDLLTLVLNEDASNRTSRATETTIFLSRESQRLQNQLVAIQTQIDDTKARPSEETSADPAKMQVIELTNLKEELAQKSAIYSSAHPYVKALRKKIAAMQQLIARTPRETAPLDNGLVELERQQTDIEKTLEDANDKLEEARLGEKMERDQQSGRLQVIEQPVVPQKPVKPNKGKMLGFAFALALLAGTGAVFVAESLDTSIRSSRELTSVANGGLIVSIPYIATRAETLRRKGKAALVAGVFCALLLAGFVGALFFGPPIDLSWVNQVLGPSVDLSWVNQFWQDHLARLGK
jgi:uncharacterized protein involved in exopolysaccharide biosynthesis